MKVSNTTIGAFVLSALALGTAFVVLLGSGVLFRDTFTLAFDFEGDVSGLAEGAPVTIKGFKIGTVRDLRLDYDVDTREFRTRALAEMTPSIVPLGSQEGVSELMDGRGVDEQRERILRDLVRDGARAQLNLQSFVTGLLKIDIDFPADPRPATLERSVEGYWLIPTQKSSLEVLQRTLSDLPLREVADESLATLRALRAVAESPDLARSLAEGDELVSESRALVQRLDATVSRLEAEFNQSADAFRSLTTQGTQSLESLESDMLRIFERFDGTMGSIESAVDANAQHLGGALEAAELALGELAVLTGALNDGTLRDSALARDLAGTLQSAARALDALRQLADYLERHPEALLRGKD